MATSKNPKVATRPKQLTVIATPNLNLFHLKTLRRPIYEVVAIVEWLHFHNDVNLRNCSRGLFRTC